MTTPMMRQYREIKEQYQDAILFFRMGDFYEMFGDDAKTAAKILEITLTTRDSNKENPLPMCGIPYHAVNSYLGKLLSKGYKVAICEQVEDPSTAKGIVRREVVKVITPGTISEKELLTDNQNNYLACLSMVDDVWGLALTDVSTGELLVTEVATTSDAKIIDEIQRFSVTECLLLPQDSRLKDLLDANTIVTNYPEIKCSVKRAYTFLEDIFGRSGIEAAGGVGCDAAMVAAATLMSYLKETQKQSLHHINRIQMYSSKNYMLLDGATRRNLELLHTIRGHERKGSLLWVLDKTVTALGGRLLKKIISQPLLDTKEITLRQQAVAEFADNLLAREKLHHLLKEVYDLERLASKLIFKSANGRDLLALGQSLAKLPDIKQQLTKCNSPLLSQCNNGMDTLADMNALITAAINPDCPVSVTDGNVINSGFNEQVTKLRDSAHSGKQWLAQLEQQERNNSGIKSLKVKYNKVFGYYFEVTKSNLHMVPEYFTRKQTLVNAERFITPELKDLEDTILGAEEKLVKLEYQIFATIREQLAAEVERIQATATVVALLDVLLSFARVAVENNYCLPSIAPSDEELVIVGGRHPVVELLTDQGFIANDTRLGGERELIVITGPNMAGKSTYMRQVALITLMAQLGSFVPADQARIPLVDRIFTRVGAADDLSTGQSTFMVEMNEVANILHNATGASLIILDEIGRGTSTYDGMAIAWAVIEYLVNEKKGARTLFATHYHQLTVLEQLFPQVQNFQVAVQEKGERIIFLRKIVPGGTDRSYGIQVARLAGLPPQVVTRAQGLLREIEKQGTSIADMESAATSDSEAVALNEQTPDYTTIIEAVKQVDVLSTTPLQALQLLAQLQEMVAEEEEHGQD